MLSLGQKELLVCIEDKFLEVPLAVYLGRLVLYDAVRCSFLNHHIEGLFILLGLLDELRDEVVLVLRETELRRRLGSLTVVLLAYVT